MREGRGHVRTWRTQQKSHVVKTRDEIAGVGDATWVKPTKQTEKQVKIEDNGSRHDYVHLKTCTFGTIPDILGTTATFAIWWKSWISVELFILLSFLLCVLFLFVPKTWSVNVNVSIVDRALGHHEIVANRGAVRFIACAVIWCGNSHVVGQWARCGGSFSGEWAKAKGQCKRFAVFCLRGCTQNAHAEFARAHKTIVGSITIHEIQFWGLVVKGRCCVRAHSHLSRQHLLIFLGTATAASFFFAVCGCLCCTTGWGIFVVRIEGEWRRGDCLRSSVAPSKERVDRREFRGPGFGLGWKDQGKIK